MSENNERKEQHVNETPKSHPVAKPVVKKKKKDERFLANPINNKRYLIPPKLVPVFKPVATLKAYLKTLDSHG